MPMLATLRGHTAAKTWVTLVLMAVKEGQGVQTVEAGMVALHEITILQDTRDGVWVRGLPTSTDIIVLGQEYVTAGQRVDATKED